jgi:cytochrome P450
MEVIKLIFFPLFVLFLHFITRIIKLRKLNLPKGTLGWPIIGETYEFFFKANIEGKRIRFIQEKMKKYDSNVFKTSLFGENIAVFCGPTGNKFLFSNENKNVQVWWPSTVKNLLRLSIVNKVGDEAKITRRLLMSFLNPETLRNYLPKMDKVAQHHINTHWKGKKFCDQSA